MTPKKAARYLKQQSPYSEFINLDQVTLTPKQTELIKTIEEKRITLITGVAGTSKTFCSVYAALKMLKENKIQTIILTKPTVIVSGSVDLGALPGDLKEKTDVYANSFFQNIIDIIGDNNFQMLLTNKVLQFYPVQYMRGCTFKNSVVLIDEFQNFHINELMTIVTRLGKNTNMIFAGDIQQNDIKSRFVSVNFFKQVLENISEVGEFVFNREDIMRDSLLIAITDKYEQLAREGKLPDSKNK